MSTEPSDEETPIVHPEKKIKTGTEPIYPKIQNVNKPDETKCPQWAKICQVLIRVAYFYETNFAFRMEKVNTSTIPTTSNDLKSSIKELEEAGSRIGELLNELINETNKESTIIEKIHAEYQDADTQTEKRTKEVITAEIRAAIEEATTPAEQEAIAERYWPETVFQKTRTTEENFQKPRNIRILLIREDPEIDNRFLTKMEYQYPRLATFRRTKTGSWTIVTCKTEGNSVQGQKPKDKNNVLIVGKLKTGSTTQDVIKMMTSLDAIRRANTLTTTEGAEPPMMNFPTDYNGLMARKIIEMTTTADTVEISGKLTKKEASQAAKARRAEENEKKNVVIFEQPENQTYASMVRNLSRNINTNEIGVKVQNMGKTQNGEIRITIKENRDGAKENFFRAIEKEVKKPPTIKPVLTLTKMILKDLEESIGVEDIQEALQETIKGPTAKYIKVDAPYTSEKGNTTAVYYIDRSDVPEILQKGKIKIGWLQCRTEKHIVLPSCRNCQRIGHDAKYCDLPYSKEKICHKCAQMGHTAGACRSETRACYNCRQTGHAASSMVCPYYRGSFYEYKKMLRDNSRRTARNQEPSQGPNQDLQEPSAQGENQEQEQQHEY